MAEGEFFEEECSGWLPQIGTETLALGQISCEISLKAVNEQCMSKRKKCRNRKLTQPTIQDSRAPDTARADLPVTPIVAPKDGDSIEDTVGVPQGHGVTVDRVSRWVPSLKVVLQFIVAITATVALVVSIRSSRTARESLTLSQQQADANRRYHQEHVKPDVRAVVRHSSSPTQKDNAIAAELVVWNNGPIKAVSLTGAYRAYILNPTNYHVIASMGISEPLVDYSFSLPEFKPTNEYVKQILSVSSPALFVVNLTCYRETDMERYSTEDYFLFENGAFYARESFKSKTNYNSLMDSLLFKMKCEAQAGSNKWSVIDPPLNGTVDVNFNVLNVPEADSPEWARIISNWTSKVAIDTDNPEVYVHRGISFHLMHRLEEAASDYERAINLGSTNFYCYCNLALKQASLKNRMAGMGFSGGFGTGFCLM